MTSVSFPLNIGGSTITEIQPRSILTRASGFMSDYDFTLNPYSGCSFACTYCYAAFFSRDLEKQRTWGEWVEAKTNALDRLQRMRTDLTGTSVYMSSVTDPYQPIERKLELVKSLLPVLAERGVRLVVQTRSALVTRDIEALQSFDAVQVNMTITTDSAAIRRAFEPACPTNAVRLDACRALVDAGIPTVITLTPLLPLDDIEQFSQDLLATGVKRFVVQPFHSDRGRFVAGTREEARALINEYGWTQATYRQAIKVLAARLPEVAEGKKGFAPA